MEKNKDIQRLIDAFTNIDNNEDMESFLADLCSVGELTAMSERLKIASKLKNGEMYSDIASSMDVSATLIAKVDDVLKSGGKGFDIALEAIEKDEECYGSFASLYDIITYDLNYEELNISVSWDSLHTLPEGEYFIHFFSLYEKEYEDGSNESGAYEHIFRLILD